jgi:hypothetical protein
MDENKFGVRVRCSGCRAINRTPGIALQNQVSKQQIEQISNSLIQHRQALWLFFLSLPAFMIFMATMTGCSWIANSVYLIFFIIALILLDRTSTSSKYLGRSSVVVFLWFVMFFLIFLILSATSYLRLKKRLTILKEAGLREG